jgi:predicted permease
MGSLSEIVNLQLMLIVLILLGAVLSKVGILNQAMRSGLSTFLIYVLIPSNIVLAFMKQPGHLPAKDILTTLLVFSAFSVMLIVVTRLTQHHFYPPEKEKVLRFCLISNNAGFLGWALIENLFQSSGILYASIAMIPIRIFVWGMSMASLRW